MAAETVVIQTKVKFQAFGKSKPSTEKAKNRRLEREQKAAAQLDDEGSRMEEIQQRQSDLIKKAIKTHLQIKYTFESHAVRKLIKSK